MPLFLAPLLAALARMFSTRLGGWILTALAFVGIQFAVTEGAAVGMSAAVAASVGNVGGDVLAWAGYLNLDRYISIIVSAYATVMARNVVMRRKTT